MIYTAAYQQVNKLHGTLWKKPLRFANIELSQDLASVFSGGQNVSKRG